MADTKKYKRFLKEIESLELMAEHVAEAVEIFGDMRYDDFEEKKLREVVELQARMKDLHERIDSSKKRIGVLYDNFRVIFVPNRMEKDDLTTANIEGVGRVSLRDDIRVKIKDKEAEFEWLEATGNGDMIKDTVNASSLAALLRRKLVAGEEIPDEIFEISPFTRASITKQPK